MTELPYHNRWLFPTCGVRGGTVYHGFVRIRHFGLFASRTRTAKLARCRQPLAVPPAPPPGPPEAVAALLQRLTGVDPTRCPVCRRGRLRVVAVFGPGARPVLTPDTS